MILELSVRANEISEFLNIKYQYVLDRLTQGFVYNHQLVAQDWFMSNPETDEQILDWYRKTDAYIYELTAYHLDIGFNYSGMCKGIVDHLRNVSAHKVLLLGDGVGDLTLECMEYGLDAYYHDLAGSKTAAFAAFRFRNNVIPMLLMSTGWAPLWSVVQFDAVIALDFFEHMTDVPGWVKSCYDILAPGGWFLAQNAFAIGDLEHGGSIPMHLTRNNIYERDWDPLLDRIGFLPPDGGWRRKKT